MRRLVLSTALLAWLAGPARAEELKLPAGTTLTIPGAPGQPERVVKLGEVHFLVEQASLKQANATVELNRRLEKSLTECVTTAHRLADPEPTWRIGIRYSLYGIGLGAAFALGVLAAR